MIEPRLTGWGLRIGAERPLSTHIDTPTLQVGGAPTWLGGLRQAVQQWGAGLVRQVAQRQERSAATRTGADGGGRATATNSTTPTTATSGEIRTGDVKGQPMAALAASARQVRDQQQAQARALVRLLAGGPGGARPLALPAPPAGPSRMTDGTPAPMATLSRALYMECLGALANAPGPGVRSTAAGAPARSAAHAIHPPAARLALPAPGTATDLAVVPAGPRPWVGTSPSALPGGRPAAPAMASGPDRPSANTAVDGRAPEVVGDRDDEIAGLTVSTPDLVEEPDDDEQAPAHGGAASTHPSSAPAMAPSPSQASGAALPTEEPPAAGSTSAPGGTSAAGTGDAPRPMTFDEERAALKAEVRELELQALRDTIQQMRDKLFQTQMQRMAKNMDTLNSII